MARHLRTSPWEDRDQEYVATPLMFGFTILQRLTETGHFAPALDTAADFFAADAYWGYEPQRHRTVQWLSSLQPPADALIARALSGQVDLVEYYRPGITPMSVALRAIFKV